MVSEETFSGFTDILQRTMYFMVLTLREEIVFVMWCEHDVNRFSWRARIRSYSDSEPLVVALGIGRMRRLPSYSLCKTQRKYQEWTGNLDKSAYGRLLEMKVTGLWNFPTTLAKKTFC